MDAVVYFVYIFPHIYTGPWKYFEQVCQTIPDVVFEILSSLLSVKVQGLHLE